MADGGVGAGRAGLRVAIEDSGSASGADGPGGGCASGCRASGEACNEVFISICDGAEDGLPRDGGEVLTVAGAGEAASRTEVMTCCVGGSCANGAWGSWTLRRGCSSSGGDV